MKKINCLIIAIVVFSLVFLTNTFEVEAIAEIYNRDENFVITDPLSNDVLVNNNFYLSSEFSPYDLIKVDVNHIIEGDIDRNMLRFETAFMLENLFYWAKLDDILIVSVSGYRSFERQQEIFINTVFNRGIEFANMFSAIPGESEHQAGLAVDLTSPEVNFRLVPEFKSTKAGEWLAENAHYFGFIIRYPEDETAITGYGYEPWHLRYLGVEDAIKIVEAEETYEEYYFKYKNDFPSRNRLTYNQQYQGLYQNFTRRDDDYEIEEIPEELDETEVDEEEEEPNQKRISF